MDDTRTAITTLLLFCSLKVMYMCMCGWCYCSRLNVSDLSLVKKTMIVVTQTFSKYSVCVLKSVCDCRKLVALHVNVLLDTCDFFFFWFLMLKYIIAEVLSKR